MNFSSGGWEPKIGYWRAVRIGQMIFVSGCTTADSSGNVVGDAYTQIKKPLETREAFLFAALIPSDGLAHADRDARAD